MSKNAAVKEHIAIVFGPSSMIYAWDGIQNKTVSIMERSYILSPSFIPLGKTYDDRKETVSSNNGRKEASGGSSNKDPVTVALNSNDPLYTEIRDLHLEVLGLQLNEKYVSGRRKKIA